MGFAIYRMATGDTVGPSIENWKLLAGGFGVAVITQAALNAIDYCRRDDEEVEADEPEGDSVTTDEASSGGESDNSIGSDDIPHWSPSSSSSSEFFSARSSMSDGSRDSLQAEAAVLLARAQEMSNSLDDFFAADEKRDTRASATDEQRRREQKKHQEEMVDVARGTNEEGRRTVWKKGVIQGLPQNGLGQLPEGS
jgi:hypothetical protein